MLYNVPVIPDDTVLALLNRNAQSFFSCYFSLHAPDAQDGRHRQRSMDIHPWINLLQSVNVGRKYLLLNSRAHSHEAYFAPDRLQPVLHSICLMLDAGVIDGIVFADAYFLQALSDAGPEEASLLQAVPSVNFMLDSFDRVASMMDFIGSTRFRPPEVLVLDRSLNRRPDALADVSTRCRQAFPGVKIELLANEGCLDLCPFKPAHDCHISLVNMGEPLDTHRINRDLGCMRVLQREPERLFRSPFIRPEDVAAYEPYVDILKLCGRTLGAPFLSRVIEAFLNGRYSGNLLDLMDAMDATAQWLTVENERLPEDFLQRLISCSKDCRGCSACGELLERAAKPTEIDIARR